MKRLLPKSLSGQLIALLLAGLFLTQLVAFLIFADERRQAISGALQFGLVERTAAVVRLIEDRPPERRDRMLRAASSRRVQFWVTPESVLEDSGRGWRTRWITDNFKQVLPDYASNSVRVQFLGERHYDRLRHRSRDDEHEDYDDREDYDEDDDDGWRGGHRHDRSLAISLRLPDGDWLNVVTRLRPRAVRWAWPSILSMVLMAGVILVVVILMLRRITRPLTALSLAAERLGRGESVDPLPETGPREIRQSTAAFNQMQERLSRFIRDRTTLLAAISHDLRTPITSLRLRAELVDDPETREKLLDTLEEMQRMTEATLAFAREEASEEATRPVDLAALVESLCADFADMGKPVTFSGAGKTPYACRPTGLKRALRNLIENAFTYGERAGVSLESAPEGHRIRIEDDGPGIPEAEIEKVFAPFVRLEESRSRETGGIGLGLAIARSIVRAHGGELTLENSPEGGLRASVFLPKD